MLSDVLVKWNASEVTAMDVYSAMFSLGDGLIQKVNVECHDLKSNPLAYWKNKDESKGHYRILFDDTFETTLRELQSADFCIMNGITYFGRKNLQRNANRMFAMIFDIDGVTDDTLNNFLSGAFNANIYPIPNYVILSGHGIHLYYLFDEPISLYPNVKLQLKNLKYALTEKMWNQYTSREKSIQYQGINQGFRVIGGKSKIPGVKVRAFELNVHPFSLRQLCDYVDEKYRVDEKKVYKETRMSFEEAKVKYPEWAQSVLHGGKGITRWKIEDKVHGDDPYALYHWWLRKIKEGASLHHRYFSVMCLAIYAIKCGVPEKRLKEDAKNLIPFLNDIAPSEPFTMSDVRSALECYDLRYCRFPVSDISKLSGIQIEKNKRNYLSQKQHLYLARSRKKDLKAIGLPLKNPEGRPSKKNIVSSWKSDHPDGNKAQCIKETGLSKPTVYKYWK